MKKSKEKPFKTDPKLKAFVNRVFRDHAWNMGVSHYVADVFYHRMSMKIKELEEKKS